MTLPILLLIAGLVVLIVGGDVFVKGSASLAHKLNVSPIVIGLTVVAFGTSAPELAVNIFSAIQGSPDIAVGNILGSNISNILLVLGIAAMIYPLAVKENTTWREIPLGILAVIILFALGNDVLFGNGTKNVITAGDGIVFLGFFAIFMYYTFGLSKVEGENQEVDVMHWSRSALFIVAGIAMLVVGAKLMVDNGVIIARAMGLSELFIGLTVVAIGTSLPELATSAIAAYRKQVDLAIGNVVGSNIFNILWVLGITPLIAPLELSDGVNFDIGAALVAALLLFIFMFTKRQKKWHTLNRFEGFLFVLMYIAYVVMIGMRG